MQRTPTTLEEALVVIAALTKRISELEAENARLRARLSPDPSTPSGMTPPYKKPNGKRRRRRPGRRKGHPGARRPPPEHVDEHKEHTASECPHCHTPLGGPCDSRVRYTEDLPQARPLIIEHTIYRYYCPTCRKPVEPPVPDALSGSTLGLRLLLTAAFLHYGLAMSLGGIVKWLSTVCRMEVTKGGLCQAFRRLAEFLRPLYEDIHRQAQLSAVLHADETGWRVGGRPHWLWCFTAKDLVFYVIERCRGSPVVQKVLGKIFAGVLVADFLGAYNRLRAWAKQRCIVHLFRELKKTSENNRSVEWRAFHKKLERLIRDALRLAARLDELSDEVYAGRWGLLERRLDELLAAGYTDRDCRRLVKRLRRHRDEIFTFVYRPDVPADNNHAERIIRSAVLMRKTYYGNRSARGAETQAILMTVFRTLELRGHDPIAYLLAHLQSLITKNQSLPLAA